MIRGAPEFDCFLRLPNLRRGHRDAKNLLCRRSDRLLETIRKSLNSSVGAIEEGLISEVGYGIPERSFAGFSWMVHREK